ncbi:MAG: hypothetical protein ACXVH0_09505, partial [Thermoanaerobaculia bacterium]
MTLPALRRYGVLAVNRRAGRLVCAVLSAFFVLAAASCRKTERGPSPDALPSALRGDALFLVEA